MKRSRQLLLRYASPLLIANSFSTSQLNAEEQVLNATDDTTSALNEADDGQFGSKETQTLLPDGMSSDQIIQFFTLFSEREEIKGAIDPMIDLMLQKGEPVEDWSKGGVNIITEFSTLDQGLAGSILRDLDEEVLTVIDLSGQVRADWSDYSSLAIRPELAGLVDEKALLSFAPGIWFETTHQREIVDNALCYSGYVGITLHSTSSVTELSEDELLTTAFLFALTDRLSSLEFCLVYYRADEGKYSSRAFTPDGYSLPVLDAETSLSQPMPVTELEAFLSRK